MNPTLFREICRAGTLADVKFHLDDKNFQSIVTIRTGLEGACRGGKLDIARLLIERGANNFNEGLFHACLGGHKELVELMIKFDAQDWQMGFNGACMGGSPELVNLMIKKAEEWGKTLDWDEGLFFAGLGHNLATAGMMVDRGARRGLDRFSADEREFLLGGDVNKA